jgi:hypothetical protein
VVVRLGGELMAPTQAAALQNFPTVTCGHTSTESMHAHTAANFWLISSFCRHYNSFQKSVAAVLAGRNRYILMGLVNKVT